MKDILQPSRADIIEANQFMFDVPLALKLELRLLSPSGTVMYYNSSVTAHGKDAVWVGNAKVCFENLYFLQECHSVCDGTGSRKQWRDSWAVSDNSSPVPVITEWLERAKQVGVYHTRPVSPAEYSDQLAGYTESAYRISWTETELDWKALCDAHPDSLFGGDELLSDFAQAEVTLFFGTEDLLLDAILLTAEREDGRWLHYSIVPTAAEITLDTHWAGEVKENILLQEEWSIIYSQITDEDDTSSSE